MKDVLRALRDAVEVLEELKLPYAVMGGLAVRVWSIPRATWDVDVTVAVVDEDLTRLTHAFEERGYTSPEVYKSGWTDQVGGMPVIKFRWYVPGGDLDVDLFLVETAFQRSLLSRRCKAHTDGIDMWVASAEDLILLKLVASRTRDLVDVADILFMQGQLDEAYLRTWADKLGVLDALEHALANHPGDERP
jgi:hypothetical protein